jgi:vacuolar-type H+-ATPase subunit I/STV1
MTKRLEELFQFDKLENQDDTTNSTTQTTEETKQAIIEIDATIDKIDAALPAVRDLESSDKELDELAELATESFNSLSDLGFNVDSRYAAELFAVAGTMLGHALTAKTTKLQKKLKVLDLQMKKMKLDQDAAKNAGEDSTVETAHGQVLSRNDLLERLIGDRSKD